LIISWLFNYAALAAWVAVCLVMVAQSAARWFVRERLESIGIDGGSFAWLCGIDRRSSARRVQKLLQFLGPRPVRALFAHMRDPGRAGDPVEPGK
jgi:hypothetical protein